jgi:hypothetical protein
MKSFFLFLSWCYQTNKQTKNDDLELKKNHFITLRFCFTQKFIHFISFIQVRSLSIFIFFTLTLLSNNFNIYYQLWHPKIKKKKSSLKYFVKIKQKQKIR